MLGVIVLLLAAIGAAVGYYLYEGRSREVTGSSTEEFLPEENPDPEKVDDIHGTYDKIGRFLEAVAEFGK